MTNQSTTSRTNDRADSPNAPQTAAPQTAATQTAAPQTAATQTAAPQTAAPQTAAPQTGNTPADRTGNTPADRIAATYGDETPERTQTAIKSQSRPKLLETALKSILPDRGIPFTGQRHTGAAAAYCEWLRHFDNWSTLYDYCIEPLTPEPTDLSERERKALIAEEDERQEKIRNLVYLLNNLYAADYYGDYDANVQRHALEVFTRLSLAVSNEEQDGNDGAIRILYAAGRTAIEAARIDKGAAAVEELKAIYPTVTEFVNLSDCDDDGDDPATFQLYRAEVVEDIA